MIGLRMFLPPSCMLGNHAAAFSATPVELMVSGAWGLGGGGGGDVRVAVGVVSLVPKDFQKSDLNQAP